MLLSSRTTLRFGTVEDVETGVFDGPAELPRAVPDTTFTWPTGPVYTVKASGGTYTPTQFQQALNAAAAQDSATILIDPGVTITGSFTLPARSSKPGWVYIASAAVKDGTFPKAPGQRVTPSDAAYMPVIRTASSTSGSYPIKTVVGPNHSARYRLVGLCVTTVNPNAAGSTTALVSFDYSNKVASDCTEDCGVDRCYLYAIPRTHNARGGVTLNCARGFVVDSWVAGMYDGNFADSQAVSTVGSPGPLLIHNNYLEAASENFMSGGTGNSGRRPEDITFTRNHLKKPLEWYSVDPVTGNYTGLRSIKNLFEIKYANRVLVEGNVLENCWPQGQDGGAILLKSAGQNADQPYHQTSNVTVRYNAVRNTKVWCDIAAAPSVSTRITENISVHDNLCVAPWGGVFAQVQFGCSDVKGPSQNVRMEWNTFQASSTAQNNTIQTTNRDTWGAPPDPTGFWFNDNIVGSTMNATTSNKGFFSNGVAYLAGVARLKTVFAAPEAERNAVFGRIPPSSKGYSGTNRWIETAWDDTAFVNAAAGDYTLRADHPWKGTGLNGRDPGVDMAALTSKITGVVVTP